jgi:hypothetical protein
MVQFDVALPLKQWACQIGGDNGKEVGDPKPSAFGRLIIGSIPQRISSIPQYAT